MTRNPKPIPITADNTQPVAIVVQTICPDCGCFMTAFAEYIQCSKCLVDGNDIKYEIPSIPLVVKHETP